jgi:hypothetical protein
VTTLEDRLLDLGEHLDAPAGATLPLRVGVRVRSRHRRSARRRLIVVFAALLVLVLALSFVPAVGDWLGVRGADVRQEPAPRPGGTELDLGVSTTLDVAARRLGFDPLVPTTLGAPDGVWLDTRPAVPIVTLTFPGGRLVSQFRASVPDRPVLQKFAAGGVRVTELDVEGHRAVFVEGVHEVAVEVPGEVFGDRLRLSDSALLVEIGELTIRIETRAGRRDAIEIARNLVASTGVERP